MIIMKINELFGLGKKKQEEPVERGSKEQRTALVNRMFETLYAAKGTTTIHTFIFQTLQKLLNKDSIDPVAVEQNDIMRESMIRTIVNSDMSLSDMQSTVDKMEETLKKRD